MPTVLNKSSSQKVEVEEGDTLYDGFQKNGQELPHGCLAGSCGTCLIEIVETEKDSLTEPRTIEQDTLNTIKEKNPHLKDKKLRLACRAKVVGNFSFKIPER
ncbi:MAG: (2Fe-2S)-binding protein [Halobacteriovoraceae bacterium]|nr:(2Fe-2S)-binding protein [Halobacteriovoraceae bacterium]